MVGAANDPNHATNPDQILGFETAPARNSASESVRRKNLTDTNNNQGVSSVFQNGTGDFDSLRYATGTGSLTAEELEVRRPRNSTETANGWNPFADPAAPPPPPPGSAKLMILQANIRGNDNGRPNSPTGGGFARSLVELYNNTNEPINLANYSLHISQVDTWITRVPLSGTIPAQSSFLIVSNTTSSATSFNATPRASLPTPDLEADFVIGLNAAGNDVGNSWKIALMVNQSTLLTDANPFTANAGQPIAGYVDMLGVGNASSGITGFEGARASGSAPQAPRRKSLTDTDDNSADFAQVDYRGRTGSNGVEDNQLYKIWPRNSTAGKWDPMTGDSLTGGQPVHPTVVPVSTP